MLSAFHKSIVYSGLARPCAALVASIEHVLNTTSFLALSCPNPNAIRKAVTV